MTKQEQIKAIIYKHTYHGGTNGVPLTIDVESIAIEIESELSDLRQQLAEATEPIKELAEIRGKTCDSCKYGTGYYRCVTCDHYEKWEPIK
jgi:hypothetical protein